MVVSICFVKDKNILLVGTKSGSIHLVGLEKKSSSQDKKKQNLLKQKQAMQQRKNKFSTNYYQLQPN